MCGFVAIAGSDAGQEGRIDKGLEVILHRGGDGTGIWRPPTGGVALAHARLAIIDLSRLAAQPMRSADGEAAIAYNGEVYNYRALARQLDRPLRSQSDTEVVLELLRARGPSALQHLRGMFAFAYWDGEQLLLARDRLGVKPLFYAEHSGSIFAGSEIAAVLAMRGIGGSIDGRALDDYLTYQYVPPPRTGVLGICELPPGHLLRWNARRGAAIERYWSVPSRPSNAHLGPEGVYELLRDSVGVHLESDVPVGVFLSGGLDSSSIVALAAPQYAGTLKTFSVTFGEEGKHVDERAFARRVADRYATSHHEILVRPDVGAILPETIAHFGQPFGNPTSILAYALSRVARKHVKVALAGDGGDEVLGGYPRYQGVWLADIVRRAPFAVRSSLVSILRRIGSDRVGRGHRANRARRFIEHSDASLEEMYFRWATYLDENRKAHLLADRPALIRRDPPASPYEFLHSIRARHPTVPMRDAAALVDVESFLPCNVLAYGDRMSMAHALEVRVPYCDHVVVEQLAGVPLSSKMPAAVPKGLLRRAMRRSLPLRVLTHRKLGFNPPIAQWLCGALAPTIEEYLDERSVRARGVFAWSAIRDLRDTWSAGRLDAAHALWSLIVAEAWMRWLDAFPANRFTTTSPRSTLSRYTTS